MTLTGATLAHTRAARNARRLHRDARRHLAHAEDALDENLSLLVVRGRRCGLGLVQISKRTGIPLFVLARRDQRRPAIVTLAQGGDPLGADDVRRASVAVKRAKVRVAMTADVRRRATAEAITLLRASGAAWWHVAEELGVSEVHVQSIRAALAINARAEPPADLIDAEVWLEVRRLAYSGHDEHAATRAPWPVAVSAPAAVS